jgi:hypothetical protein
MRDTGTTLFGMKVYESDALRDDVPIVTATTQRHALNIRAEYDALGKVRFVATAEEAR